MTAADTLAALLQPPNGNVTGARGTVTAIREDGLVNVRIGGAATLYGVPCIVPYEGRQVGDVVQVLQIGSTWVVIGPYGSDPLADVPLVTTQSRYLYNLATNAVVDTQPSTFRMGQDPAHPLVPAVQLAIGYWNGTKNVLTSAAFGHSLSSIFLTVTRSTDSIGNDGPITVQVVPHNSDTLPTTSITPLKSSFSTLLVNLEVGERKDIPLPADWIAGIAAAVPTIRGFLLIPGQTREASQAIDTTYAIFSKLTGGITFGQWQAWQPVWSAASGTAPAIGNGSITGRYSQTGKTVHFTAQISAGSTTTFGSGGGYQITYPVPPRIGSPDMVCFLRLGGVGSWLGQGVVADNVHMNLQSATSTTDGRLAAITSTAPVAMTSTMTIRVNGTYEAA